MLSIVPLKHVEPSERQNAVFALVNTIERGVLVALMLAFDMLT